MTHARPRPHAPIVLLRVFMTALALSVTPWASGPVALAQETGAPPADGGARVRDLEDEVARLRQENEALQQRVRDLQAQVDRLQPQPAAAAPDALPLDPYASPASLLAELKRRYSRDLGDLSRGTQTQRDRFEAQARRWCDRTRIDVRGRTRWLALLDDIQVPEVGTPDAMVRVLDEFTHKPVGEGFRVELSRAFARRARLLAEEHAHLYANAPVGEAPVLAYEITGMLIANPACNGERTSSGVFDFPPVVGPCVEFGARLDIDRLDRVELPPDVPRAAGRVRTDAPAR